MRRKSWYETESFKGVVAVLCILFIGWAILFSANARAERLNQLYGTQFDAADILMGNHKYMREVRLHP